MNWTCPECDTTQKGDEVCENCGERTRYNQVLDKADTESIIRELADRFGLGPGFLKAQIPEYRERLRGIRTKVSPRN